MTVSTTAFVKWTIEKRRQTFYETHIVYRLQGIGSLYMQFKSTIWALIFQIPTASSRFSKISCFILRFFM